MSSAGAVFLAIISILFWLIGFGIFSQSKSAVHEIEVLASFIIAAILLVVGAILASCITSLRGISGKYHLGAPNSDPILAGRPGAMRRSREHRRRRDSAPHVSVELARSHAGRPGPQKREGAARGVTGEGTGARHREWPGTPA